jgi:hypothetical protein
MALSLLNYFVWEKEVRAEWIQSDSLNVPFQQIIGI